MSVLRSFKIPCIATLIVSSVLLVVSLSFVVIFPTIYRKQLDDQLTLKNGTVLYQLWKDLPLPVFQRLYFFNITNAAYFVQRGRKLHVVEIGPYTYRSEWTKEDIVWHPNGTVSYREVKTFHFVPEESAGSEDDYIVTLNGPLIAASSILKDSTVATKTTADVFFTLYSENLIIKKTVSQLAFEGYNDPIIRLGKFIHPSMPFKDGKFGWLYGRNHTDDGVFTVYTGEGDIARLNIINEWDGQTELVYWKADACNAINGTNGEVSPPLEMNQTTLQFFQPFFCRSMAFEHSGTQIHEGIATSRFEATESVFANRKTHPENACFDTQPNLASGVQDISACQYRVPVILSFPHFYLADSSYLHNVSGLEPNASLHGSHIDVEPTTGVTLDLIVRFQVNLQVFNVKDLHQFSNVTAGVYPVMWVEMEARLNRNLAIFFQHNLQDPKTIGYAVLSIVVAIFAAMAVGSIWILCLIRRRSSDECQPLMMNDGQTDNYSTVLTVARGVSILGEGLLTKSSEKSSEKSPKYVQVSSLHADGNSTGEALESSKTESVKNDKSQLDMKEPTN